MLLLELAYKYKCGGCNATCCGKIKRHFTARICEYIVTSHLTEKKLEIDNSKLTGIQEHLLCSNYCLTFQDFSILKTEVMTLSLK